MAEALLLIDLQRDYFADGELAQCRADLVDTTNRLVQAATESGLLVVEVRTEHDPAGSTWTLSMREDQEGMALAGTEGAQTLTGLDIRGALELVKTRDSAFFGTELHRLLADHQVHHVVLCGVSTESCIAATARDAFAHDLTVTLVEDATASIDPALHDQTLAQLSEQYRQQVAASDDVLRRWAAPGGTAGVPEP